MRSIDWNDITKFKREKFPEDPDKFAEPELIYRLQFFRIKHRLPIYPSPVKGALARFDGGTSQHAVDLNKNKLSKAIDVFPTGIPYDIYSKAMSLRLFNGIGIYLDTNGPDGKPWVMFHFDIRPLGYDYGIPLIWIGIKKKIGEKTITSYKYPQFDSKYWKLFNDERVSQIKKFGIERS